MSELAMRNIGTPDETREFAANGRVDLVTLPGLTFSRATFEPGWRWTNDVKPLAGTDSCQANHFGYIVSGRLHIVMDDGTEGEAGPGDVFVCSPGHDAYVVGDEPCVALDFSSDMANYAKS